MPWQETKGVGNLDGFFSSCARYFGGNLLKEWPGSRNYSIAYEPKSLNKNP